MAIEYELEQVSSGGVLIHVTSNLPDSAELMGSFYANEGEYFAQDVAPLRDGVVALGPFTDDGAPLEGDYDLSVTLSIARNQPEAVQACIGKAGELLTGPLVSADDITGDNFASVDELVHFSSSS